MTDTVRIMPRQPIEARASGPHSFAADRRGVKSYVAVDDEARVGECILPADKWVEVSDPIVWDGSDGSFAVIQHVLGKIGLTVEADGGNSMTWHILVIRGGGDPGWTGRELGNVSLHARIQIVGDSFVILPPEVAP